MTTRSIHVTEDAAAPQRSYSAGSVTIQNADVLELYDLWPNPVVIVSDGPYGLPTSLSFGDVADPDQLLDWYEPHIEQWSAKATPQTTLWFWNSEIGWATVHPSLVAHGWKYVRCNIWDKGLAHIAGNSNTQKLRQLPTVSEVCVQYTRHVRLPTPSGEFPLKEWVRREWERTGIPLNRANEACHVRNAATRKYLTRDRLWYFPPPDAFGSLVKYANERGEPTGRPYFSADGDKPISSDQWARMRPKFTCPCGVTNVWREPPVNGKERLKKGYKALHLNQKPLKLISLIVSISSDANDVVWEPFGGLCPAALASYRSGRRCHSAEIDEGLYQAAVSRLAAVARWEQDA